MPCIVCGDFNVNFLEESVQKVQLQLVFSSFNMRQLMKVPTRTNALLDLIFTNIPDVDINFAVIDSQLSDHLAQILSVKNVTPTFSSPLFNEIRIFNEQNNSKFSNLLAAINWSTLLQINDANTCFNSFQLSFMNLFNQCFPVRRFKFKNSKPWWNRNLKEIKEFIKSMEHLKRSSVAHHASIYKQLLKKYRQFISEAKRSYMQNQIDTSKNKVKTLWDIINRETGRSKASSYNNIEIKIDNSISNDPLLIAEHFNEVFLRSINTSNDITTLPNTYKVLKSIFLFPVDAVQVRSVILSLNNCKSCGVDDVPISVIKGVADIIAQPLAHCINRSLEMGVFPAALKHTLVKPLFKKGDRTEPLNYRGIYLSTNFGKLYESILKERLEDFFDENDTISRYQHGFRKKKSVHNAISELCLFTNKNLSKKNHCILIFIDLTRAFDHVSHSLLLNKLEYLGIRGIGLKLLQSYLWDRTQTVCIETVKDGALKKNYSKHAKVEQGVFAGTLLGPLLFNIFLNDVFLSVPQSESVFMTAYADDIAIGVSSRCVQGLYGVTQNTLNRLNDWFSGNGISINVNKSKFMLVKSTPEQPLYISGCQLESTFTFNYLGLMLDAELKWNSHIAQLCTKLSRTCFIFRQIRNRFSFEYLKTVYHSIFESNLRYGIRFWGHVNISSVLAIQKRCLRFMLGLRKFESCRNHFQDRRLMTVVSLYLYEVCNFVHQNKGELFSLVSDVHHHNTRRNLDIYVESGSLYKEYLRIYNTLPSEWKATSVTKFKKISNTKFSSLSMYSLKEFYDYEW